MDRFTCQHVVEISVRHEDDYYSSFRLWNVSTILNWSKLRSSNQISSGNSFTMVSVSSASAVEACTSFNSLKIPQFETYDLLASSLPQAHAQEVKQSVVSSSL